MGVIFFLSTLCIIVQTYYSIIDVGNVELQKEIFFCSALLIVRMTRQACYTKSEKFCYTALS